VALDNKQERRDTITKITPTSGYLTILYQLLGLYSTESNVIRCSIGKNVERLAVAYFKVLRPRSSEGTVGKNMKKTWLLC